MKNINNPNQINRELLGCIDRISHLTMEATVGLDRLATRCDEPSDLVFFNELASGLELMQSQLDYYFPAGERSIDLDEWADTLAVLNSGADYTEDQVVELDARFDESHLSECLRSLSLTYVESIPLLIAARLVHEEPEPRRTKPGLRRRMRAGRESLVTH